MINKHIEVVKRWLADNTSVSLKELKANTRAAIDEASTADRDSDAAAWVAVKAASAAWAASAAQAAVDVRSAAEAINAAYWVGRYEGLTNGSDRGIN